MRIINVIKGKRASFLYPFLFLYLGLSLCSALIPVAALVFFMSSRSSDSTGQQTDALISAYAAAAGIALLILAVVFVLSLIFVRRKRIYKVSVEALLPGHKWGFIPCPEGIYKFCCRNPWSKSRFYYLYPWASLSLYAVNEKKKCIVLKAEKIQMPLIPWSKETKMFSSLKALVLEHLPEQRRSPAGKRTGYRWIRVIAAILIILALQSIFANQLENAAAKRSNAKFCDVSSKIHYSFKTAFATEVYFFETYDDKGQTLHRYCELHGIIYVILHPAAYAPTLSSLLHENEISHSPVRSVMILEMIIFPAIVWLDLLIIVIYTGKPKRFRFNVL